MASNIQLRFLCPFDFLTSFANAEHLTAGIQSWMLVDPTNAWEIPGYVKAAVAIVLSVGLMVAIVRVARGMINRRQQVPALPASVSAFSITPILPKNQTPFPIIPAIPPTAGSVPGNAIDDALARSPFPTRSNSPLSWL